MSEPLIDVTRLGLTNAQTRDFSMLLPYMQNGNWVTTTTLKKAMYQVSDLSRKEISKVSSMLSKLYHETELLERKEKRRIYFQNLHKKHQAFWSYRIRPDVIKEHEVKVITGMRLESCSILSDGSIGIQGRLFP